MIALLVVVAALATRSPGGAGGGCPRCGAAVPGRRVPDRRRLRTGPGDPHPARGGHRGELGAAHRLVVDPVTRRGPGASGEPPPLPRPARWRGDRRRAVRVRARGSGPARPGSSWPARCRCRSRSGCRCRSRRWPARSAATPPAPTYRITQRVGQAEILPGVRTPVLGYDGIFPGPTIEARRGRPVVVRHRNELPVPTVVHLHGGHTAGRRTTAGRSTWCCRPATPAAGPGTHGMVGDARRGGAGLPLSDGDQRAADALVPRPPDGLHRSAGLPRAGRLPPGPRRRRGRAAAAPRAIASCR